MCGSISEIKTKKQSFYLILHFDETAEFFTTNQK